jgi:hypothetical protein
VRRCSPTTSRYCNTSTAVLLSSFAMYAAFPRSDYYEDSVPPRGQQSTVDLPAAAPAGRRGGQPQGGSHVHHEPVSGLGAQLCPCSIATPTPQAFDVASGPTKKIPTEGVARSRKRTSVHCYPGPHPPGWSRCIRLRGFQTLVPHVHLPASLAEPGPSGSASPPRRCQGCFPPSPAPPGSGCPQLHRPAATGQRRGPFIPTRSHSASWRTFSSMQRTTALSGGPM